MYKKIKQNTLAAIYVTAFAGYGLCYATYRFGKYIHQIPTKWSYTRSFKQILAANLMVFALNEYCCKSNTELNTSVQSSSFSEIKK